MANLQGFNAAEVEPNEGFEPLPAGHYSVVISDSEMKPTKSGNGNYLKLCLDVIEGQYRNRKLFLNLNLDNPNPQAVQIARGELSAICRAVGVMTPKDSAELHNIPMVVKVACKNRADNGELENRVTAFHPKGWKPGGGDAKAEPAMKASPQASGDAKPMAWMKK